MDEGRPVHTRSIILSFRLQSWRGARQRYSGAGQHITQLALVLPWGVHCGFYLRCPVLQALLRCGAWLSWSRAWLLAGPLKPKPTFFCQTGRLNVESALAHLACATNQLLLLHDWSAGPSRCGEISRALCPAPTLSITSSRALTRCASHRPAPSPLGATVPNKPPRSLPCLGIAQGRARWDGEKDRRRTAQSAIKSGWSRRDSAPTPLGFLLSCKTKGLGVWGH